MNTKTRLGTDKYAAIRALQELDDKRNSPDWAGDTGMYPALEIADLELSMSNKLPALVQPQAE